MKVIPKILLCIVLAALLAFISGQMMLKKRSESIVNGVWITDQTTGSAKASIYHRARIARSGIWALASSEVIYFYADKDSDGNLLRQDCTYKIIGNDPDTRWWSVTAYKNDHFIPNSRNRYSYSKSTVQRESDGRWEITLSPTEQEKNWLSSGNQAGQLVLLLRNYNPSQAMKESPQSIELPKLFKERSN